MGENDYKLERIKQGLDPVCTNQSTRHMHTLRLYDCNIVGLWGGGLVLDCYKSAKKKQTSDGENDRSRQFTAISQRCQGRDPGVVSATIYASRKFHHAGHLAASQCTRVRDAREQRRLRTAADQHRHTVERNRTAGVNIGRHRTHDKNTNLQIAAGSGSIGWHGLGSARYIWRTSDRVVECHTFACSEHPIVISGT